MLKYDPVTDMFSWPSNCLDHLSDHFAAKEFNSKDPMCKVHMIRGDLVRRLEEVRIALDKSIYISSAYRTKEDQERLAKSGRETAKGISQHCLGAAADIYCSDMDALLEEVKKHFKAIGVAKTFIHVDLREDKERLWFYTKT